MTAFGSPSTPANDGAVAVALPSRPMQALPMRRRMSAPPRLTVAIAILATGFLTLRLSLEGSRVTVLIDLLRPVTLALGLGLSAVAAVSAIASLPLASPFAASVDDDTP